MLALSSLLTVCLLSTVQDAPAVLDPLDLVLAAPLVVKLVMISLVVMSLLCWFIIGAKTLRIGQALRMSEVFVRRFWDNERQSNWSSERFESIYAQTPRFQKAPLAMMFQNGYIELAKLLNHRELSEKQGKPEASKASDLDMVHRSLRRSATTEITQLESMLSFLATTASTAPFIGLFGTVWGIMHSFLAIYGNKSAGLDVVAPGIAEALIATAIGLVAAIPAAMAYNYFIRRIRILETEINAFEDEFLNVTQRYFLEA